MDEDPAKAEPGRYRAFISYSHGDAKFAHWLHRKLESWRLPDKSRLAPVFIDRAELAAGSDLSAQVREALEQSAALVVVCSPNAKASRWVGQEIALFRSLHPDRAVLAALIDGEPVDAFPDPLLGTGDAPLEPLAADFRKGHDGQRLGLLKLVAGLTKLPLDQLVQRDAATRQRRVMAITAAALALVLVLSAALVVSLRARAEAERQRAEAEGLVEFMLTDLRPKLKGAAGIKVMESVNARAFGYYVKQDLSNLSDDSLERRARLLHAMGEDEERQGRFPEALAKYKEAHRFTAEILSRRGSDPDALFTHGQSEFWVGQAAWKQGDLNTTRIHWTSYKAISERLGAIEPGSTRALMELGFASGNLCELASRSKENSEKVLPLCEQAEAWMAQAMSLNPANRDIALALANRLDWHANALTQLGRPLEAIPLLRREARLVERLLQAEPENSMLLDRQTWPMIGEAKALAAAGRHNEALAMLERADLQLGQLSAADPTDMIIIEQRLRIAWLEARSLRVLSMPANLTKARLLHRKLKSKYTSGQLTRFNQMLEQIEEGRK